MSFNINFAEKLAERQAEDLRDADISNPIKTVNEPKTSAQLTSEPLEIGIELPERFEAKTITSEDDPADIPVKFWLSMGYILCGYICLLIAPGAAGKSILTITEAISIALGRDLLKLGHVEQGNVLLINNEDDNDELLRRIDGVCREFKVNRKELANRLFFHSGYGKRVIFATELENNILSTNEADKIVRFIKEKNIRLLIVDPFISTHNSEENNNSKIDQVIQVYRQIAIETNVAIRIVHHTPKCNNSNSGAGDVDMARGASSLKDGARVAHTLFPMSNDEAKQYGICMQEQLRYVRLDDAKTNFSLKTGKAKWLYKKSVTIANGEVIGVLVPRDLELVEMSKEEKAEKDKSSAIHDIAQAAINKLGDKGGKISSPDLLSEYMNISSYRPAQAKSNISLLPLGSVKKELVKVYGKAYRIYQTKEDKKTATRYVHIDPDE